MDAFGFVAPDDQDVADLLARFNGARLAHGAFQRKRQVPADKAGFGDRAFNPWHLRRVKAHGSDSVA